MYLYQENPFGLVYRLYHRTEVTQFYISNQTYIILQMKGMFDAVLPLSTEQEAESERSDSFLQSRGAGTGKQVTIYTTAFSKSAIANGSNLN